MEIKGFPTCCNAHILTDFGGTDVTAGTKSEISVESLITELGINIRHYGSKCLVAFTNDEQANANAALHAVGFKHSDWMAKRQHPSTKLCLWWREPDV